MNKGLIVGLFAVVLVAGGIIFVNTSSNGSEAMMAKKAMEQAELEKAQMVKDEAMKKEAMEKNDAAMSAEIEAVVKTEAGAMMDKNTEVGSMNKEETTMMKKEETTMMKNEETAMMAVGSYEPYAASKVAMASESKDVVLFFRASWCPFCKVVDADIKANLKAIPSSLTILDVDYDNSADLKKKYGVTTQHTFVQVDAKGTLIKKWSGSATLAAVVAEVQ